MQKGSERRKSAIVDRQPTSYDGHPESGGIQRFKNNELVV
jgi:hypothetical protein